MAKMATTVVAMVSAADEMTKTVPPTFKALTEIKTFTQMFEDGAITYAEYINKVCAVTQDVIGGFDTDYIVSVLEMRKIDSTF